GEFTGIPPSETTTIIKVDPATGQLKTDINTVVITPRAPSAGYVGPSSSLAEGTGPGTGTVSMTIIDPALVKNNHRYRVEFVDSTAFHTNPNPSYLIRDITGADTLLRLTRITAAPEVTTVLDGFSVAINNDPTVAVDQAKTRWTTGNSNYLVNVGFDSRFQAAYAARRVNYPADFQITFGAAGQGDKSFPIVNNGPTPQSNITVKNLTEGTDHVQFIFRDENNNGMFDDGDAVFIVYGDSAGKPASTFLRSRISWSISLAQDTLIPAAQRRAPQPGDVYVVSTHKPFRTGEHYDFVTTAPAFNRDLAVQQLKNVAVVPNPYVGAASWEPATKQIGRGPRLIYFIHLPAQCTIRIYTISGRLVQTIVHSSTIDDGQEAWNLVTRDGMDLAYGIYIFHVDAGSLGTRIDRFAVLK
ncbi:MAG TPA: hypothetical protein VF889_06470, partial [Bacteroidota bacterium]